MRFEDLVAWQQARQLVSSVYRVTGAPPLVSDFGLSSQIQRAAVSIMTNIAEGFERQHLKEKSHFYSIARASAGEVRSLSYVIDDNYPKRADEAKQIREETIEVGKLISGLIRSTSARTKS